MSSTNPPSPSTPVPGLGLVHYPALVRSTDKGWRVEARADQVRTVATHKQLATALSDASESLRESLGEGAEPFRLDLTFDLGDVDSLLFQERADRADAERAVAQWKETRRAALAGLLRITNRANAAIVLNVSPSTAAQIAAGTD